MALFRRQALGPERETSARVFASLDDLARLKHRAHGFSFRPRQPVTSLLTGRHGSRLRGPGLSFEELRSYVEGDDIRAIDWLATARLRRPHVRVFSEERDRPVLLLVDQRAGMFFGSSRMMKAVAAADAAALAAWRVTSLGDRVGAIVFGVRGILSSRPLGRDRGAMRVLGLVVEQNAALNASIDAQGASALLNEALRCADAFAKHDALVCLISDGTGVDQETERLVSRLAAHNDVLALFVYDPMEASLPDVGRVVVGADGRQLEIDTGSAGLRTRFSLGFSDWRARLAALSRDRAIPVLPISTHREMADQLRELIGRQPGSASRVARRPDRVG